MIGVLLSGGVDSLAMMELATMESDDVIAIYINWGQPAHWFEDFASLQICKHYGVPRRVINVPFFLSGPMHAAAGKTGPRVVKGRNLAFVSMTLSTVPNLSEIWIGAVRDDYDDYDDCRPAYMKQLNCLLANTGVHLKAKLILKTKKEVHDFCLSGKVPIQLAWSCYNAVNGQPCKTCDSCASNDFRHHR